MTDELVKRKFVDVRYDAYRSFFDHTWVREVADRASGSPLDEPLFDLNMAWKAAANTQALPWLTIQMLGAFAEGYANAADPYAVKFVRALEKHVVSELGDGLSELWREKLLAAIARVEKKVQQALDAESVRFDAEQMWNSYFESSDFIVSLWGSQQICYAAVYYAFEDFLTRCVAIALGMPSYRMPRREEFSRDFAATFGIPARDACWSAAAVNVARLARHAIVHNGGRETSDLARTPHSLTVTDGYLQIMAPDTAALYGELKARVGQLVTTALSLPQFSSGARSTESLGLTASFRRRP